MSCTTAVVLLLPLLRSISIYCAVSVLSQRGYCNTSEVTRRRPGEPLPHRQTFDGAFFRWCHGGGTRVAPAGGSLGASRRGRGGGGLAS